MVYVNVREQLLVADSHFPPVFLLSPFFLISVLCISDLAGQSSISGFHLALGVLSIQRSSYYMLYSVVGPGGQN